MTMSTALEVAAIGPDSAGILMSVEEFDAITEYDECYRYELIHGVLVVTAVPLEEEASPNETLGGLLFLYHEQHPLGSALDLTLPERYVHLPTSRRRPDRVIWAGLGRRPDPKIDPPTIAVEFVSAGKRNWRRDYVTKRSEYLELGIAEYWIFNRFDRSMTVHRNSPEATIQMIILEGEVYRTPLLPGFELPLSRLLAAADAWGDPA
jgi:Uma2 family endonuclease